MRELAPLDARNISAALRDAMELEVHDALTSTNDRALELVRAGRRSPLAILAETQTAGRGRQGRHWQSPQGQAFCLTLLWPFAGAVRLEGLSLVAGAVLAEVIGQQGLAGVRIKWPNDLYVGGRKLGGVLVELAGNLMENPVAVIGIGINARLGDEAKKVIDQPVTDWVAETGGAPDRNRLAAGILNELAKALPVFATGGFAPFRARWLAHDLCIGHGILLRQDARWQQVSAIGVADDGSLVVRDGERSWQVHGGEVSVRINAEQ